MTVCTGPGCEGCENGRKHAAATGCTDSGCDQQHGPLDGEVDDAQLTVHEWSLLRRGSAQQVMEVLERRDVRVAAELASARQPTAVVMEPGDRLLLLMRDHTDPDIARETADAVRARLAQADGTDAGHISVLAGASVVVVRAGVGRGGDEPQVGVSVG